MTPGMWRVVQRADLGEVRVDTALKPGYVLGIACLVHPVPKQQRGLIGRENHQIAPCRDLAYFRDAIDPLPDRIHTYRGVEP